MNQRTISRSSAAMAALLMGLMCAVASAAGFFTQSGKIYDPSGQEIQIRGISHQGFNSLILQPQFLWAMGWKEQIAQIKSLGFNAVRLPFVPDTLYNKMKVDQLSYVDPVLNPELIGKTPLQALDLWMAEADRQGIYILLDFHSISMQRQYPTWFVSNPADFSLVYNNQAYTKEDWARDLAFVAKRYAGLGHFFGIDLYNEPNGIVRWSVGDPNDANPIHFWKAAAELASAAVLAANPNLLIFVQGINGEFDGRENSAIAMNWGEDFQPEAYQPLNIPGSKLVLTPHTYGPDVYVKSSFSAPNFPANLAADWDTLFGHNYPLHPVVVGEWGGKYGAGTSGQRDVTWQNAFVDYLIGKGIRSSFYWCYTPNSSDTGGILDDNLKVRADKLALLQKLWGVSSPGPKPPAQPAASGYRQPTISTFSPRAGPVGTVVTLTGAGLTGTTVAWVGAAKNGLVKVVSDAQLQVTIPAGATSGAIGVLNPTYAAFTAAPFVVVSSISGHPQPSITTFSPLAGPVGTVVTIHGAGFTGVTQAWVGSVHKVSVKVIGDTQIQVTVPVGAKSSKIGILNPVHAAFTATAFTVR
jgi:endoglucanase